MFCSYVRRSADVVVSVGGCVDGGTTCCSAGGSRCWGKWNGFIRDCNRICCGCCGFGGNGGKRPRWRFSDAVYWRLSDVVRCRVCGGGDSDDTNCSVCPV